jgi:hypothetical protein
MSFILQLNQQNEKLQIDSEFFFEIIRIFGVDLQTTDLRDILYVKISPLQVL